MSRAGPVREADPTPAADAGALDLDQVIDVACALADHDALDTVHVRTLRLTMEQLLAYRARLMPHGATLTLDDAGVVIQPLPRAPHPSGIATAVSLVRRFVQPSARKR